MPNTTSRTLAGLVAALLTGACTDAPEEEASVAADAPDAQFAYIEEQPALHGEFEGAFLIGAAVNRDQVFGEDARGAALIRHHFNAISPENDLKWERVHPEPGRFAFEAADRFVEFGERNGMYVVGHTLVWHSQTPRWVFEDAGGQPLGRDSLLARMRDHIHTVVGRYRGRIDSWDVVNEALNEDGTLRESPWHRIIGEDYIAQAFRFAHEADPAAKLYYNDYSLERADKRAGAVRLIRSLQAQGVPVHGIGTQGHHKMDWPSAAAQDSTIQAFSDLGVEVAVTEIDVDVLPRATASQGADVGLRAQARDSLNPYAAGLPASAQQALARRYAELFQVYLKHAGAIERVTFWGVTDGDSWLNNWPVRGRTSHPLLLDREGRPKPAFDAVVEVARGSRAVR